MGYISRVGSDCRAQAGSGGWGSFDYGEPPAVCNASDIVAWVALVPTVFVTWFMLQEESLKTAKPRVLVVEDNKVVQFVAISQLKRCADVEVHVAGNGLEAIKQIQKHDFAFILMDVRMPEMDGLEATRAIRKIEAFLGRRTPIIAVTASENQQQCIEAGMDDYVTKPADYARIIQKWLPSGHQKPA